MAPKISIKTKNNKNYVMSIDSYSRWLCLAEAMTIISENAQKNKVDLNKNNKWIKPLAIQKYIKQRFPSMNHDFKVEESLDF
jgi:hypothetical protein